MTLTRQQNFLDTSLSRRRFMTQVAGGLVAATALGCAPARVFAATQTDASLGGELRDIALFNQNTQERISTVFFDQHGFKKDGLYALNHFLRDSHANKAHWMDPRLMTMLYDLQTIFDKQEIEVISGYRTERTNAMLSRTIPGVAKDSFHMKGQAVDIRIKGVDIALLHEVALTLSVGGVGYYPSANFIHIDTGPMRTWRG